MDSKLVSHVFALIQLVSLTFGVGPLCQLEASGRRSWLAKGFKTHLRAFNTFQHPTFPQKSTKSSAFSRSWHY